MSKRRRRIAALDEARREWDVAVAQAWSSLDDGIEPAAVRSALVGAVGDTVVDHFRLDGLDYFCRLSEKSRIMEEDLHLAAQFVGLKDANVLFEFTDREREYVEQAVSRLLGSPKNTFRGDVERCLQGEDDFRNAWPITLVERLAKQS